MKLTPDELALFEHIDSLIPDHGHLEYDFRDEKQYQFAIMLMEKNFSRERYPGAFKQLELIKEEQQQPGFTRNLTTLSNGGWQNMYAIPGLGLSSTTQEVSANGMATVVGGYSVMNLSLIVQNNTIKEIVASGAGSDFNGELLSVSTTETASGTRNRDVTAYLHYSYNAANNVNSGGNIPSGLVKRAANQGPVADPKVSAPVRTTTAPANPNAINIGLGRPWTDQGGNSQFDYAWNEPNQGHPVGKIPFIGQVTFNQNIKSPLQPGIGLLLRIYVADRSGGGATPQLDAKHLNHIYSKFTIDPNNPKTLKWNLPPGISTSDAGDPITFGNVTWSSDIEAFFYCGISVVLEDGSLAFAAVQSKTSPDEDALDGITEIKPIEFIWHCLAEGTMITMSDGSTRPIEAMLAGDSVCTDPKGTASTVVWTNKGLHKGSVIHISTESGTNITASHNHVFITTEGPSPANELKKGDQLMTTEGLETVSLIEAEPSYSGLMYNLAMRDYQEPSRFDGKVCTYIANGLVVGDTNAQRALKHIRKNDIEWIKQRLPSYMHKDVDSHFSEKKSG